MQLEADSIKNNNLNNKCLSAYENYLTHKELIPPQSTLVNFTQLETHNTIKNEEDYLMLPCSSTDGKYFPVENEKGII